MEKPIVNPQVPYTGVLSDPIQQGKMLRIQGAVPHDADRFSVNLQTGPNLSPRDNTALHISVRLKQGYIARNSYLNRTWGEEDGRGGLPIGPGQQFEIILLAEAKDFKIAVNGQHYGEFPYRLPIDKITHLNIEGDVVITLISWEGALPTAPPEGGDVARAASKVEGGSPGAPPGQQGFGGPPSAQGFGGPPSGQGFGGPPSGQGFGGPPSGQGFGGPPSGQGFGGPPSGQGFGGPPSGQGFGGPPPQGYGPPPQGFGGPQGYGPPPPPGSESQSGFDHFLGSAQSVLADAISSGAAEKLLGNILHPNQNQGFSPQQAQYGQYPHPTQQQQQQRGQGQGSDFNLPQMGGEGSVGGLGSVGSFLSNLAGQVLKPQQPQGQQGGYGQYNQRNQYN